MTGNKINSNPSFTGEEETIEKVIEPTTEDEAGEQAPIEKEEDEKENSTEESPVGENELDNEEDEKKRALAGLQAEEERLRTQDVELDTEIAKVKERIKERRSSRRDKREILEKADIVIPSEEVDTLADIDETTLAILERFTKAKGLVPKAELEQIKYQETHKTAEELFYANHPEYLPENDANDELYSALKAELALYAKPSDAKLVTKLFEKAHTIVKLQHPDKFSSKPNAESVQARNQKLKVAQMGGGQGGSTSKKETKSTALSADQIRIMKDGGWTDEDITNFNS